MRLFPSLTEEFTSPLPPAELLCRVGEVVEQGRAFTGTLKDNGFTLSRVINYRNSMLPRIEGWITAGPAGGSCLRLRHQLHPFVLAFAALWLGGVGSVAASVVLSLGWGAFHSLPSGVVWPSLIPVGMLAVGLLLFTVPFWLEVRQSRPQLVALLQLEPVLPAGERSER